MKSKKQSGWFQDFLTVAKIVATVSVFLQSGMPYFLRLVAYFKTTKNGRIDYVPSRK